MGEFELEFVCPNPDCRTILVPKAKDLGKSTTCPVCMAEFIVPAVEGEQPKVISLPEVPEERNLATNAQLAELKEMGIRSEPGMTVDDANELLEKVRTLIPYVQAVALTAFGWNLDPFPLQRIINFLLVQSASLTDIMTAATEARFHQFGPHQIPTDRKGYAFVKFTIRKAKIASERRMI